MIFVATLLTPSGPGAFSWIVVGSAVFVVGGAACYTAWYSFYHEHTHSHKVVGHEHSHGDGQDGGEQSHGHDHSHGDAAGQQAHTHDHSHGHDHSHSGPLSYVAPESSPHCPLCRPLPPHSP